MSSITLTAAELVEVTGYRRAAEQLAELQRRGFVRARKSRLGDVILERAHYDAVCSGAQASADQPRVRPVLRAVK